MLLDDNGGDIDMSIVFLVIFIYYSNTIIVIFKYQPNRDSEKKYRGFCVKVTLIAIKPK